MRNAQCLRRAGVPLAFAGSPADWPQWRGPTRDGLRPAQPSFSPALAPFRTKRSIFSTALPCGLRCNATPQASPALRAVVPSDTRLRLCTIPAKLVRTTPDCLAPAIPPTSARTVGARPRCPRKSPCPPTPARPTCRHAGPQPRCPPSRMFQQRRKAALPLRPHDFYRGASLRPEGAGSPREASKARNSSTTSGRVSAWFRVSPGSVS